VAKRKVSKNSQRADFRSEFTAGAFAGSLSTGILYSQLGIDFSIIAVAFYTAGSLLYLRFKGKSNLKTWSFAFSVFAIGLALLLMLLGYLRSIGISWY
jgi:hypothetical protein